MLDQLRDKWANIEPRQKRTFTLLGTTLALMLLFGGILMRTRGAMVQLYASLAPNESREIAAELSRMGIESRISEDEASISVPAADEPRARMRLASAGLPHSAPPGDWDIFDRSGLAVTQSQQEAMKIRALQGSLARSIASLDSVSKAAVHITLPERSPFLEDAKPAKAAVLIHLLPGRNLDRNQAQAVAFLVSNSVPDLSPENVTIMDEKGALLFTDNVAMGSDGKGTDKLGTQLQRDVQTLLDTTFGLGKTIVRAAVELETDRTETVAVEYRPADPTKGLGLPASETETVEDARGMGGGGTAGTPGVGANLFGERAAGGNGVGEYNRTETERKYENPRTETVTVKPPGSVRRVSLGIFIDESLADQQAKIETVARAAAGIQADRGDTVSVEAVKFATTEVGAMTAGSRFESVKTIVRWVLNSLALIVGLLLFKSVAVAFASARPTEGLFATGDGRLAVETHDGSLQLLDSGQVEALRQQAAAGHVPAISGPLELAEHRPLELEDHGPSMLERLGQVPSARAKASRMNLEELLQSVQQRPIDDVTEVVRHWLEGSLDG